MTEIWMDAQLSPSLAAWINRTYDDVEAQSVRAVGLRDAEDEEIFQAARDANIIMMSKDNDFLNLLDRHGLQRVAGRREWSVNDYSSDGIA